MKICKRCGSEYESQKKLGRARIYCSDSCRQLARDEYDRSWSKSVAAEKHRVAMEQVRSCLGCRKEYRRIDGGFYKYCSEQCRKRNCSLNGNRKRRAREASAYIEPVYMSIVYNRDSGICQHCKKDTVWDKRGLCHPDAPELDHIIPISVGGHHAEYNCQILCRDCNTRKGNKINLADRERANALWPCPVELVKRKELSKPLIWNAHGTTPSSSGVRGVCWIKAKKTWRVTIQFDGKRKRIGEFKNIEDAKAARVSAEISMGLRNADKDAAIKAERARRQEAGSDHR